MNSCSILLAMTTASGLLALGPQSFAADQAPGRPNPGKRPNILLIMTDQQSADAMSWAMGREFIHTPAMDALAAQGTVHARAYAANPLCVPSRTSMFNGHYPHQTGVMSNDDAGKPVAGRFKNLGTLFKDAGYDTGYVGKWHMAYPVKEVKAHGFDFMRSIKNNGIDEQIPGAVGDFLKAKRDKPFLLVASFVNPHNICEWPRGEKLPDGEVGTPPPAEQCPPRLANHAPMADEPALLALMRRSVQSSKQFPVGDFTETQWRQYRWAYFRMIEKVDALVGKTLQELREAGQYDHTVIVFTSDHGDMQGAHGWNQKTVFFDESARVPFIISVPGARVHRRSEALVNTGIDLLPTLCGLAGLALPASYPGSNLVGSMPGREYIVIENRMVQGEAVDGRKPAPTGRMVRSGQYKYCVHDADDGGETLVDMTQDPGEMVNLAGKPEFSAILSQHRGYLASWAATWQDPFRPPLTASPSQ